MIDFRDLFSQAEVDQEIAKRLTRRRVTFAVLPAANHVVMSPKTLTLAHGGQVLTSVVMSPTSGSITTLSGTVQLVATALDASSLPMAQQPTMNWASTGGSNCTVTSAGLVSGTGNGTYTITASVAGRPQYNATATITVNIPAGGTNHVVVAPHTLTLSHQTNLVPTYLVVTPSSTTVNVGSGTFTVTGAMQDQNHNPIGGYTVTWASSASTVASVGASTGVVTVGVAGAATITGTIVGTSVTGTCAVTVQAAPGTNEPAGMTTVINTGSLTVAPATAPNTPWQNGQCTFTGSSPAGAKGTDAYPATSGHGEVMGNLYLCPDGPGYRIYYAPNTTGGYSPVRFSSNTFSSAGTGVVYLRMRIRYDPAFTTNGNVSCKIVFPRSVGSGQNHCFYAGVDGGPPTTCYAELALQSPNGANHPNSNNPQASWKLTGGAWHTLEWVLTAEATAGQATGTAQAWLDGVQICNDSSIQFFNSGETTKWSYLEFDPTYGGGSNNPPAGGTYWDFDSLYVSVK